MLSRSVFSTLILSVFIAFPMLMFFQNCAGGGGSSDSARAGQSTAPWPYKISGDLVSGGGVDLSAFEMNADGSKIVFLAAKDTAAKMELYVAGRDGAGLLKLSGGGSVDSFKLLDDTGATILYLAEETPGSPELFSIGLDGTGRHLLSGPSVAGHGVLDYEISADRQYVVYRADKDLAGVPELYASALGGGADPVPVKLHPDLVAGQMVSEFKLTTGGIILRGALGAIGKQSLYAVGFDGGGLLEISAPNLSGGAGVDAFQTNADGGAIAYAGDLDVLGRRELFLTSADGSGQAKISQTPVPGGRVGAFALTPLGQNVIYLGNLDDATRTEIYQRDLVSLSAPVKLNPPLVSGGNVTRFTPFTVMTLVNNAPVLAPAVAFVADSDVNDQFELFSTADLSAPAAKASGAMVLGGDVLQYAISPDGHALAYIADQEKDGRFELFMKKMDASPAVKLVPVPVGSGVVPPLAFAPDNQRVMFVADLAHRLQRDLYIIGLDGGGLRRLSHSAGEGCDVYTIRLSADGAWFAYAGDQSTDDIDELYSAPLSP
jgi:hypothetical protein